MSNTPNLRFRRKMLVKGFRSSGEGAVNDCQRPSRGVSKADLMEWHRERIKLRKARRSRLGTHSVPRHDKPSKSDNPAYRKSIWPANKIARRAQ